MKKLMFAAVAAAMAAVASAECGLPEVGEKCGLPVWDFQMVLRADTFCQCYAASQAEAKSICGITTDKDEVCVNWRALETRAFSGVLFVCDCAKCSEWQNGLQFAMYDVSRGMRYYDSLTGWSKSPKLEFTNLYRFGLRGEQVAALATLAFTDVRGGEPAALQLAGHGAFPWNDLDLQFPSYIGGFVTGTLGDAFSCNSSDGAKAGCNYYELCVNTSSVTSLTALMALAKDQLLAVAYGQFAMQLNVAKSAVLKASYNEDTKKYNEASILPAWFLQ